MSSRVLNSLAAESAKAVPWQLNDAGTHGGGRQEACAPGGQPETDQRIRELETDMARRVEASRQAGMRDGEARAAAAVQPVLEKLSRTIAELSALRPLARREAEQDVVRLAMAVARKILYREIAVDPHAILGLVKAALEKLDSRELHRVRLHPVDVPVVREHIQKMGLPVHVEVQADQSLERGAAIFETSRGNLDASVSTQLAEIEHGFADLVTR